MPGPRDLLANALERLEALHRAGQHIVASADLSKADRTRLVRAGWLRPVVRGWYLSVHPAAEEGDTTSWLAHWSEFIARYAASRFGDDWHLSPEISLLLQTAMPLAGRQVVIHTPAGHNNVTLLAQGWSVMDYRPPAMPPAEEVTEQSGLRLLSLPYALSQVGETFFRAQKGSAEVALGLLPDVSDLARILLDAGKPVVAGRLAGALRAAGRGREASELRKALEAGGYRITETNPFEIPPVSIAPPVNRSPYVLRLRAMWTTMREPIIEAFDAPPGRPANVEAYLADLASRYVNDAYHSLSIEGYAVTPELIERVRTGLWNPDDEDKASRDAMAAKGYALAHERVKAGIERILKGANAGEVVRESLAEWNSALWEPSVQAGILKPSQLAGYRNGPVYIRNAEHVPPPREAVRDCMPEFFALLEKEESAAVRAVLGHFAFVFIHPYADGNGRVGRFIMNAMLASGGYPWTVIPVGRRPDYFRALDEASARGNIEPLAKFLWQLVRDQSAN